MMSVKSLYTFVQADRHMECAVMGSGLIALLTALELSKKNNMVTIYADKFPKLSDKKSS